MRRFPTTAIIALLALLATAFTSGGDARLVSGPSPLAGQCGTTDRTVLFGEDPGAEEEATVAVDPTNPDTIVAAWTQDRGLGIVTATSLDGGQHWTTTVVPGLSSCTGGDLDRVIHPRLSFGPDGALYLLTSPLDSFWPDPRSGVAHQAVSTSRDAGQSWSPPVYLDAATGPVFNDLGGLAAEPDVAGAAVVVWSHPEIVLDTMFVSRTTDHGQTWTTTQVRDPADANVVGKTVVAHPDGTLLVFVQDQPLDAFFGVPVRQNPVSVIRSTDKGATWSDPVELVADSDAFFWPVAAAAPDGTTYVLWGTATDDGRLRLWQRTSDDAGATWDAAREVVTIDAGQHPSIVAQPNGLVGLAYYEVADDQRSVVLTASADGGRSWTTTSVAGPFAEDHFDHWLVGPVPISYQLGLAPRDGGFTTAFVATGELAVDGLTDVWALTVPRGRSVRPTPGGDPRWPAGAPAS